MEYYYSKKDFVLFKNFYCLFHFKSNTRMIGQKNVYLLYSQ
jgi:hypothetical protein